MREAFYGTCAAMFEFKESQHIPTMGVCIKNNGLVACYYNPEFLKTLNLKQLYAIIKHECEHIIRLHPVREESREHSAFNIATDMAINGHRSNPTCAYKEEGREPVVPTDEGCYIPEDWPEHENAETYYNMLPKCPKCNNVVPWDPQTGKAAQQNQSKDKDKDQDKDQHVCPGCGRSFRPSGDCRDGKGNGGQLMDDHGTWKDSDVSEDEARQIVKQIVEQAASNSQGNVPGHLKEFIDKLVKPVVRWREIIRRFLGRHVGGCRRTFSRRNRRHDIFGIKGVSHHAVATLGVIVDTSGSIGSDDLRQFFAEIEAIGSKTKTWVLQFDAKFQSFHKHYRRGDWKKIPIAGRGGTKMDLAQEWVIENKIPANAVIMLTDGETPWREEPMPIPFFVCLTKENEVPDYAEHIVMPTIT